MLFSCSSGDDSSNIDSSNSIKVTYEVLSSSAVNSSLGDPMITYVNSTGQLQTESISTLLANNPWSKTFDITTTTRPLQLSLLLSTSPPDVYRLFLDNQGSITQNIYINNELVASSTNTSASADIGGYNITINSLEYLLE